MSYGENLAMTDFTPPIICGCKIVQNKIVFCVVHKQAEKLLVVCEYLWNIISDGKLSETKDRVESANLSPSANWLSDFANTPKQTGRLMRTTRVSSSTPRTNLATCRFPNSPLGGLNNGNLSSGKTTSRERSMSIWRF